METVSCKNPDPCEHRSVTRKASRWPIFFQFVINLALFFAGLWMGHAWRHAVCQQRMQILRADRDKWLNAYQTLDKHAGSIQDHFDEINAEHNKVLRRIEQHIDKLERAKK